MDVIVSGHHLALGETFASRIRARMETDVAPLAPRPGPARVTVSRDDRRFATHIDVRLAGHAVHVEAEDFDPERSFEKALRKLTGTARRIHDRRADRRPH